MASSISVARFALVAMVAFSYGMYGTEARLNSSFVTQWNEAAQQAIRLSVTPSQIASRTFALLHASIYRTLISYKTLSSTYPDAVKEPSAIFAGHYVLSALFPEHQSTIFDGAVKTQLLAYKLTAVQIAASKKLGKVRPLALLTGRLNDNSQDYYGFVPGPVNGVAGLYQFVPGQTFALYPQLGITKPFYIKTKEYDTYFGPYLVPSPAYNAQRTEVLLYGNSTESLRTDDQTASAFFWADGTGTSSHAGHWFNIAFEVLSPSTPLLTAAKAYALIGVAQYDANIAAYYQKYKYKFWRPITAITQGDSAHLPDPSFSPLLSTPPHPEYPSGHSVTASSSAYILSKLLKLEDIYTPITPFTIGSEGGGGVLTKRTYSSLADVVTEVGDSRVFGGIHFRKSIDDGFDLGQKTGEFVFQKFR